MATFESEFCATVRLFQKSRGLWLSLWSKTAGPVETMGDLGFGNGVFVGWLSRVCFAAGRFVLVTPNGDLRISTDGMSWSREPTGLENWAALNAIGYGNGRFFAVGNDKAILISQRLPDFSRLQLSVRFPDPQTAALSMAPAESDGALFSVERSADLKTWEVLGVDQSAQSSGLLWSDAPGGTAAARTFYRARAAVVVGP